MKSLPLGDRQPRCKLSGTTRNQYTMIHQSGHSYYFRTLSFASSSISRILLFPLFLVPYLLDNLFRASRDTSTNNTGQLLLTDAEQEVDAEANGTDHEDGEADEHPEGNTDILLLAGRATPVPHASAVVLVGLLAVAGKACRVGILLVLVQAETAAAAVGRGRLAGVTGGEARRKGSDLGDKGVRVEGLIVLGLIVLGGRRVRLARGGLDLELVVENGLGLLAPAELARSAAGGDNDNGRLDLGVDEGLELSYALGKRLDSLAVLGSVVLEVGGFAAPATALESNGVLDGTLLRCLGQVARWEVVQGRCCE